jgi:NADPH:quinone reductase-like Zn-dependent oxidoreductase
MTVPVNPPTMRAVIQDGYGAPERLLRLAEIQVPSIGADDVLIRMRATSVNTPDWATVTGVPYILRLSSGLRRPKRPVRGSDVAGVVEAVGRRITDLAPGADVSPAWRGRQGRPKALLTAAERKGQPTDSAFAWAP